MTIKNLAASLFLVSAFLAWQAISLKGYIQKEKRPPAWDQAIHMEIALDYRNAIREGRWGDVLRLSPKPGMPPFPPLYQLALVSAYDWNPSNPAGAALWVNWAYLVVLAFSIFGIAYELKMKDAWLPVVAFLSTPAIQDLLHTQLIDLAVVACVAAAYWAYLNSRGFLRWGGSLAFGLINAIGMMHKWSYFSYLLPLYWQALMACSFPESRRQTLAAGLIAAAGFLPWYLIHLPVMLPRLAMASSDFAVPVWQGDAFLRYLYQMPAQLGPPLFIFGCIGLLVPLAVPLQGMNSLLRAWFFLSYIFWAMVPNRQMRFLLPGLVGFSVLACAPWPRYLLWALAGFQILTAANYTAGWIPTLAFGPGNSIVFFQSAPPSSDNWPIGAILQKAESLSPRKEAFSNLTLVANDERFNGPVFTWMTKWLDLHKLRIRGVNSRLCEFSRFVVLKTGSLGPPAVIGGLPEAAGIIQDSQSWFTRAYSEEGRWPLPDKSEAVLYGLRPMKAPPFRLGSTHVNFYNSNAFSAKNLRVDLKDWIPNESDYRRASISADQVRLRGLEISHVDVDLEGVEAVPVQETPATEQWNDVRILKMRTLRVKSLEVQSEALQRFLEARLPGLIISRLSLDGGLQFEGQYKILPLQADASVHILEAPHRLAIALDGLTIGFVRVPLWLLGSYRNAEVSLEPNPETPFRIELAGLTFKDGRLTIP